MEVEASLSLGFLLRGVEELAELVGTAMGEKRGRYRLLGFTRKAQQARPRRLPGPVRKQSPLARQQRPSQRRF